MPRFSPEFIDELKSRLRPSDVIGRYVKLRKQGAEWAGLSPFTKEKTPSFFVNDQKGFYHCFSSGKHGDVISFLTETQKIPFHEAVARLAEEAGMALPAADPREAEREEARKGLAEACAFAAGFFQAMLRRADGRAGAEYVAKRGLSAEQLAVFGVGYAPEHRSALKDYLVNKGYTEDVLVEAGLLIRPEDGGAAYDRFRHRVMFPIADLRGRIIAFGGRALDPEARAKYLNSPETPLFHKGDVLYNLAEARKAASESNAPLIVCEGYMDVIALWGAGFRTAVAPLGTALTEGQLALLWRSCDEPVLCFDGDKAGIGAAFRAIDRAMPVLRPGKSLRFAFLPDGKDPDDLVRSGDVAAFRKVIEATLPLSEVLWRRETEARPLDTPERRAALKAHLRDMVKAIADKDVRAAYGADLARRLDEAFAPPPRPARAGRGERSNPFRKGGPAQKADPRVSPGLRRVGAPSPWSREATLLLAAINHPVLVERRESAFGKLVLETPDLARLLARILSAAAQFPALDSAALKGHLQSTDAAGALERILRDEALNRQSFLRPETGIDEVERGWNDALRHHLMSTDARQDLSASASRSFTNGEDAWKAAVTAREELRNSGEGEARDDDGDDVTSSDFNDRLERMRASVKGKTKRR